MFKHLQRFLFSIALIAPVPLQQLPLTPPPTDNLCWDYDQAAPPTETFEEFIEVVGRGTGIYTHFAPSGSDFRRLDRATLGGTFGIEADAPVDLILQLFTQEAQPQSIRYMVLHNEQQLTLPVNDDPVSSFDVLLQPGEMQTYSLSLPALPAGLHDIVLIGVRNFAEQPSPTGTPSVFSFRMTLIAGDETGFTNGSDSLSYTTFPAEARMSRPGQSYPLALTLSDDTIVQWSFPDPIATFPPEDPLQLYALVGYASASFDAASGLEPLPASQFALLAFVNYQQVPISASKPVIYGEVLEDTLFARIPMLLPNDYPPGTHELMIVKIEHPRVPLCVLIGPPDGYFISPQVMYNRAAFEIAVP